MLRNRFIALVLKQYNVGIWLGALQDQYQGVAGYVNMINFTLIVPTAYHVALREPIQQYFPWMTFWLFASFCVIAILMVAIIRWKIILPSQVAYNNRMRYTHGDMIRRDIAEMREALVEAIYEKRKKRG